MVAFTREEAIVRALEKIFSRTVKANISDGKILKWDEPNLTQPTEVLLEQHVQMVNLEIPMELLRFERDQLLTETDWRVAADYPNSDQALWLEYRQKLRDLPNQILSGQIPRPVLDEERKLKFNNWPKSPS